MAALLPWLLAVAALGGWARALARARARRELTLRAGHEVRGPLTAASLALHLARRSGTDRGAALTSVERELRRAGRALDDLGAASLGQSRPDRPETVRIGPLLAAQAETWRPVAWSVGADLRFDGCADVEVTGDPHRLVQATSNLIANALEHGGRSVSVGAQVDGDRVRIEVGDDGPGLSLAARPRRLRVGRRGRSGRGLGLRIVADVAARHGGRLLARPEPGAASVAVELPRKGATR